MATWSFSIYCVDVSKLENLTALIVMAIVFLVLSLPSHLLLYLTCKM